MEIRESRPADLATLESIYAAAFPDEDLLPLLRALLRETDAVLSLVAEEDSHLVGHVAFTWCDVAGQAGKAVLLGPLAVTPARQRQGIGGTLVRAGLERLKKSGAAQVHVLGDPAYYGRFGFQADGTVAPPYAIPAEWAPAWQSLDLIDGQALLAGKLGVPGPWRDPALWAP